MNRIEKLESRLSKLEDNYLIEQLRYKRHESTLSLIEERVQRVKNTINAIKQDNTHDSELPECIVSFLDSGVINKWKNQNNVFEVVGVPNGLLILQDDINNPVIHKRFNRIKDKDQRVRFAQVYTDLKIAIINK